MPDNGEDPQAKPSTQLVGAGVAIGAGAGTALFAATSDAWWIGIGAGVGVALGAAASSRRP